MVYLVKWRRRYVWQSLEASRRCQRCQMPAKNRDSAVLACRQTKPHRSRRYPRQSELEGHAGEQETPSEAGGRLRKSHFFARQRTDRTRRRSRHSGGTTNRSSCCSAEGGKNSGGAQSAVSRSAGASEPQQRLHLPCGRRTQRSNDGREGQRCHQRALPARGHAT